MTAPFDNSAFDDRAFSEQIALLCQECGALLNAMHEIGDRELPADLKPHFRRALGNVMAELNTELFMPLLRRHPDLEPKEMGSGE